MQHHEHYWPRNGKSLVMATLIIRLWAYWACRAIPNHCFNNKMSWIYNLANQKYVDVTTYVERKRAWRNVHCHILIKMLNWYSFKDVSIRLEKKRTKWFLVCLCLSHIAPRVYIRCRVKLHHGLLLERAFIFWSLLEYLYLN